MLPSLTGLRSARKGRAERRIKMGEYRVRTNDRFGTGFDTGERNGLFFEQAKQGLISHRGKERIV